MSKNRIHIWTGKSGTEYKYTVLKLNDRYMPEDTDAIIAGEAYNYIYSILDECSDYAVLFVGESDSIERHLKEQATIGVSKWKLKPTHLHVRNNPDSKARRQEQSDISEAYIEDLQFNLAGE